MTTNERGQFTFTGFLGDYALTLGDDKATFSLAGPGEATISVNL
jgi:hypothetical protein